MSNRREATYLNWKYPRGRYSLTICDIVRDDGDGKWGWRIMSESARGERMGCTSERGFFMRAHAEEEGCKRLVELANCSYADAHALMTSGGFRMLPDRRG